MQQDTDRTHDGAVPEPKDIVSVNSRGGSSRGLAAKLAFLVLCLAIVLVAGLMGLNRWRAAEREAKATALKEGKEENKPALIGQRRTFDTDPPVPEPIAGTGGETKAPCADSQPLLGPDGKPLIAPTGQPLRVCKDGKVFAADMPPGAVDVAGKAPGTPPPSRYAGEMMVPPSNTQSAVAPIQPANGVGAPTLAAAQEAPAKLQANHNPGRVPSLLPAAYPASPDAASEGGAAGSIGAAPSPSSAGAGGAAPQPSIMPASSGSGSPSQQGAFGNLLNPSQTDAAAAAKIGDQSLIIPKGRTIDCALSTRVVNEVSGMASCVITSNVYSDNGRVVLLERGSEVVGEYNALVAQGQRRLFVLWNRVKTPKGVTISLNSPAADGLGTAGMDGYVDNRWAERIGAAFLLSLVQDVLAYETAKATGGNGGATGVAIFQNSAAAGNRLAEKVLESTINIKPSIYKSQGDRVAIYVARDLDFGTVYALRTR
jgi:type IV secretion system protein VirB10